MKLLRIFAIAALAMISGASAQAGVVLSNMGATGNDLALVSNSSTDQTGSTRNAAGFKTGTNSFTLDSISAAMASQTAPTVVNVTFAIYSDSAGKPGSSIATSVVTSVGNQEAYNFVFTGSIALIANTKYWAVVETGAGSHWYGMSGAAGTPTPQNGSGLTFLNYDQTSTFNSTKTWFGSGELTRYGFAVFGTEGGGAVPEPALTSLLCLGGVALIRRRMKK